MGYINQPSRTVLSAEQDICFQQRLSVHQCQYFISLQWTRCLVDFYRSSGSLNNNSSTSYWVYNSKNSFWNTFRHASIIKTVFSAEQDICFQQRLSVHQCQYFVSLQWTRNTVLTFFGGHLTIYGVSCSPTWTLSHEFYSIVLFHTVSFIFLLLPIFKTIKPDLSSMQSSPNLEMW
jgi:hypothetical protein